jgi:hypothetical protein
VKLLTWSMAVVVVLLQPTRALTQTNTPPAAPTLNTYLENGALYFPPETFKLSNGSPQGDYGNAVAWYLKTIKEPPIFESKSPSDRMAYRFILIGFPAGKTWVFRLEIDKDGNGKLFVKHTSFEGKTIFLEGDGDVSVSKVNGFLDCIKSSHFMDLPTRELREPNVNDGSYWFIEGMSQGIYHAVCRRAPELHPNGFTDIGKYMAYDLGGLSPSMISLPSSNHHR